MHSESGTAGEASAAPTSPDSGAAIVRVETYALAVPLATPIGDANADLTHWVVPAVEIETSDGLIGTGISGVHSGADLLCSTIDHHYAPILLGRDSRPIGQLWQDLFWSKLHWVGRGGIAHMAVGMVDIALWDLAARRSSLPLWRLLGGSDAPIETYNTDGGWLNFSIEQLISRMMELRQAGFQRVKMKLGHADPRVDLRRLEQVVGGLPDDTILMVDVNQMWDLETASRMLPELERLGIAWLEEPLRPEDVRGHRELQRMTSMPIATGESLYTASAFVDYIEQGALRIAQPDATRLAGVTEWLSVAAHASNHDLQVVPHAGDMMQLHQHLSPAVRTNRQRLLEYIPWTGHVYEDPARVADGFLQPSESPGASTRIRPDARAEHGIKGIGRVAT